MALEATKKDLDQDKKINATEKAESNVETRLNALERQMEILAPLAELLGVVAQVKRHFS